MNIKIHFEYSGEANDAPEVLLPKYFLRKNKALRNAP